MFSAFAHNLLSQYPNKGKQNTLVMIDEWSVNTEKALATDWMHEYFPFFTRQVIWPCLAYDIDCLFSRQKKLLDREFE